MAKSRPVSLLLAGTAARPECVPSCAETALAVSEKTVQGRRWPARASRGRVLGRRRCLTRSDARAAGLFDLLRAGFHRRGGSTRGGLVISGQVDLGVIAGFVAVSAGMVLGWLALFVVVVFSVGVFPAGYGSAMSLDPSVTLCHWWLQAVVVMSQGMFGHRGVVLLLVQDSSEG